MFTKILLRTVTWLLNWLSRAEGDADAKTLSQHHRLSDNWPGMTKTRRTTDTKFEQRINCLDWQTGFEYIFDNKLKSLFSFFIKHEIPSVLVLLKVNLSFSVSLLILLVMIAHVLFPTFLRLFQDFSTFPRLFLYFSSDFSYFQLVFYTFADLTHQTSSNFIPI